MKKKEKSPGCTAPFCFGEPRPCQQSCRDGLQMSALCNEQRTENIRFDRKCTEQILVDHHSTELLQRETDQLIQSRNIRCILFDFGDTVFMDSSGIGMLLGRYKMIRFVGGTMAAINVKERMRRVLLLSGVYRVIDIYEGLPQQSKLL